MTMQLIRRTVFIGVILSCTTPLFAVTPQEIFNTILWLVEAEKNQETLNLDTDQLESIFLAKKNQGKLGLRIICNTLSSKSCALNKESREYKLICAAWHLVQHYLCVDMDSVKHENDDNCSICLSQIDNDIFLHCGHQCCASCLLQWFAKKASIYEGVHHQCSICRSDIGESLKNFLQHHVDYQNLVFQNQAQEEEDYRSLLNEQNQLDQESILYWFGQEAIRAQQAFDEYNQHSEDQNFGDEYQEGQPVSLNLMAVAETIREVLNHFMNDNYE